MTGHNCGCEGPMNVLARKLHADLGRRIDSTNLGVSGQTTRGLVRQLDRPETQRAVARADVIVLVSGANDLGKVEDRWQDGGCSFACFEPVVSAMGNRVGQILDKLRALPGGPSRTYLVMGYWGVFLDGDVAEEQEGSRFVDWAAGVTAAANLEIERQTIARRMTYVDLVAPVKGAQGLDDPSPWLADDGDHLNAEGVELMAEALAKGYLDS